MQLCFRRGKNDCGIGFLAERVAEVTCQSLPQDLKAGDGLLRSPRTRIADSVIRTIQRPRSGNSIMRSFKWKFQRKQALHQP